MTRSVAAAAALLLATVGVAACGGGDDGSSGAGTTASRTAASAASATPEIGAATQVGSGADGGPGEEAAPDTGVLDQLPPAGVGSGQTKCPAGPAEVTAATLAAVRSTTLCLLNAERTTRSLKPLRINAKLARAATAHAADMVARRYFAHNSPDGGRFSARIQKAGYMAGARRWNVGENLAWGAGPTAAVPVIVDAWMHSPPHKANILEPSYREVGIGLVLGTASGEDGVTYATEFGRRA